MMKHYHEGARMNKKYRVQQGFSLIELAIVIIISGVLFAAAVTGYKNYFETSRVQKTQVKFDTITRAMDRFFEAYGRYPCPARLDLGPNDVDFGVETNCSTTPPASGISVTTGDVNVDNNPITRVNTDIRVGAIPFTTLKIGSAVFSGEEEYQSIFDIGSGDMIDTYNNKFTYALTESQGTQDYIPYLGAVIVEDEHGKFLSANNQSNHADYVVVSHGERDEGAWTYYGQQVGGGCAATMPDNQEENCDGDNTYISSLRYDAGADDYDDVVLFRNWVSYFLWDLANEREQNIYNLNSGNVGVGITEPIEKLHIFAGNTLADEAAIAHNIANNNVGNGALPNASVLADEYCNFTSGVADGEGCFTADTIAGDQTTCDILTTTGNVGNLAVNAIRDNTINCETVYDGNQQSASECPTGEFLAGFSYNSQSKTLTADCEPL